jgi:hypothetical protein
MAACYAPEATFSDPVFTDLKGREPGEMWRMLTSRGGDLKIDLVEHDDSSAHWIARYTFTQTGRKVVNDVRSSFRFDENGQIAEQKDEFDFTKWARQAIGLPGLLPPVRSQVRKKARAQLDQFMSS